MNMCSMNPITTAMAAARADLLCNCGHASYEHRELPPDLLALVDGAIVSSPNPDYRAFAFPCHHDGCSCVIDKSQNP